MPVTANTRVAPIDLTVDTGGSNQLIQQATQLRRAREQREQQAAAEAEAVAAQADEQRRVTLANNVETRMLNEYNGDVDLISGADAADLRREMARNIITQRVRNGDGDDLTDEDIIAVVRHFGNRDWVSVSAMRAGPANVGEPSPARQREEAEEGAVGTGSAIHDFLFKDNDTLTAFVAAVGEGTGGLANFIGEGANSLYDQFQQSRAISAEVDRIVARNREAGVVLVDGGRTIPLAEFHALPVGEQRAHNMRIRQRLEAQAERNISEELARLDTPADNFLTRFGRAQMAKAESFRQQLSSPEELDRQRRLGEASNEGVGATIGVMLEDPVVEVARLGGFLLGSGGAAGGTRAAAANTLGSFGRVAAAQTLRSNAARVTTQALSVGGGATGGVTNDVRNYLDGLDDDQLAALPIYADAMDRLGEDATAEEVRTLITETLAGRAQAIGATASIAGIFIGGQSELLAGTAARAILSRSWVPFTQATRSGVVRGAAREAIGEAIEEGGQELARQVGMDQEINVDRLRTAAGVGAIIGGPIGGVTGGLASRTPVVDPDTGNVVEGEQDVDQDALDEELVRIEGQARQDQDFLADAQNDPLVAEGAANPAEIVGAVRAAREDIGNSMDETLAALQEQDTQTAAQVRADAEIDFEGTGARAVEARERLAFDAMAEAFTAREPGYAPFLNSLQRDATVERRTGSAAEPDNTNPLLAADRRRIENQAAQTAVAALPQNIVPAPIVETVARVSQRSSKLMAGVQRQFTAKNVEDRRQSSFERMIERGVPERQARDLSAQMGEVPRGEIAQVLEDLRQQQPGLTQALDVYSADFDSFRQISNYRRQLNSFVRSQQGGDTARSPEIARSPKFIEAIERMTPALEAAGIEVPTVESLTEGKAATEVKRHGATRIAQIAAGRGGGTTGQETGTPDLDSGVPHNPQGGISRKANTRATYKDFWEGFKRKPLDIDNVGLFIRASQAAIPQLVHRADNADILRVADNARQSRGIETDVTLHDRFGMSIGLAKQNQGLIEDAVVSPMRDTLEAMSREMGYTMEQTHEMVGEFLFARHVPERIAVQRLQDIGLLTDQAKRDWIVIDRELRRGDMTPKDARAQLEAIFDDPANYKRPADAIPLADRRYNKDPKGMTAAEAQETVEAALAIEGQRAHLERLAELNDRAAGMVRNWMADANVGGRPIQNIMDMYGWRHYIPVAVQRDNAQSLFEVDSYSPRNAGRQRMNGTQETDIQSPVERMYISLSRAALLSAEKEFMADLAQMTTDLDNAGFATIQTNEAPKLNPKTGRHFHENMPSASETNKFVNHKPDGTYDVITVNQDALLQLLDKRYEGQEDSAFTSVVRKGTRGLGRLYTNGPDYMFGTGMWRDMQEAAAAALVDSGDRTLASKARVVANQMENQMRAAMASPKLAQFYGASPTRQQEMAVEFRSSEDPILQAAGMRYEMGGIVGFRSQLGPDGIFLSSVEGGDPLKARNALQRGAKATADLGGKGLRLIDAAMTTLDNQARDAAFATMVANGVSAEKAVALTRNIMNFDQRAELPAMSKISAFWAFANTSVVGAQTAVTRRLFRGNDVPTKVTVSDSGTEVVSVDWSEVPKRISYSQLGAYTAYSGLSTMALVWGAGMMVDDATGDEIPVASTIPASRYMTAGLLPEIFDSNGEIEPTRIPVQYGVQMLVHSTAAAAALATAGTHSNEEIIESLGEVWLSVFNPFGRTDPGAIVDSDGELDSRVIVSSHAPSLFAPLVQAMTNTSGFGTPLFRESFDTDESFFADPRGRASRPNEGEITPYISTPELYVQGADAVAENGLAQLFNMDAPETQRHLARSYLGFIGRFLDNQLKETQRKVEDPSYESNDWARNLSGSPVRSVNDARYFDQGRVGTILSDAYFPINDLYQEAREARNNGDTTAMAQFRRDYPEWTAMSTIARDYFSTTRELNEQILAERQLPIDPDTRERIHSLHRQREQARTTFLRRWYEQFPETFPTVGNN